MTQHKWHKEIKAWADGAKIEHRWIGDKDWQEVKNPIWTSCDLDFRIKPQPKEPQYLYAYRDFGGQARFYDTALHRGQMLLGKIKLEVDND